MFFFKKSSPILKNIIPDDYVDIHSHLLPNIDDGSKSFAETHKLISNLKQIGFSKIITTPHIIQSVWNNTATNISQKHQETLSFLQENNEDIPMNCAAEYMLDGSFWNLIKNEAPILTLKNNFVLIEMSYINPPIQLYEILFDLQVAGYKPILAHPERYNFYHANLNEYSKLKKAGCLFQLNLLSTVGYYGTMVCKTADFLLKNNLIDYVGSDVHHQKHIDSFDKPLLIKNHQNFSDLMKNNIFFDF